MKYYKLKFSDREEYLTVTRPLRNDTPVYDEDDQTVIEYTIGSWKPQVSAVIDNIPVVIGQDENGYPIYSTDYHVDMICDECDFLEEYTVTHENPQHKIYD